MERKNKLPCLRRGGVSLRASLIRRLHPRRRSVEVLRRQNKLIVVLGPTASGKSDLAVELARKFNGEVISADSRQVYKGMDIGTGKITPDTKNFSNFSTGQEKKKYVFIHKGIPHYLIDVASPKSRFTVSRYRKLALKAIDKIFKQKMVPIICGGTGFYIQAVIDGIVIPEVKPDWKLRKKLEKETAEKLFEKLKKLDQKRAKNIDKHNKRRLIRAVEIVLKTKNPVPQIKTNPLPYPVLQIGIKKEKKELKNLIEKRLKKRLQQGMVEEVKCLHKSGVSWNRLEEFGLEYRYIARYLQKEIKYQEMVEKLQKEIEHFAKRQMTWFSAHGGSASGGKHDRRIHWIKNKKQAEKLTKQFLK